MFVKVTGKQFDASAILAGNDKPNSDEAAAKLVAYAQVVPGQRVLDLGAFPGSWTSYAAQKVGPKGKVLGIDLTEFRGVLPPWASIRQGDALTLDVDGQNDGFNFLTLLVVTNSGFASFVP